MKIMLLALATVWCGALAHADSCVGFTAEPDSYFAAPGESWEVLATYTNCGNTGYIAIGSGFGTDESLYATEAFADPTFFLAPGDSENTAFGTYTWELDAPEGLAWNVEINSLYEVVATSCNGISVPCQYIAPSGIVWTDFTAYVEPVVPTVPIPEPGMFLLLGTGLIGLGARLRKRTSTKRSGRLEDLCRVSVKG